MSNYRTSRKYGANFNLLLHDLWGADSTETNEMPFPGDNGDWNNFDTFMKRLTSDIKSNDMQDGLIIDIWNEPDLDAFWKRPQKQYIDTWARAYGFLRYVPDSIPLCLIQASSRIQRIAQGC